MVKGYFEMKNKNLMEYDTMFCSLIFKVNLFKQKEFDKKIFTEVNSMKICLKTNGNIVKVEINSNFTYFENFIGRVSY
jgi:hypothetical protein